MIDANVLKELDALAHISLKISMLVHQEDDSNIGFNCKSTSPGTEGNGCNCWAMARSHLTYCAVYFLLPSKDMLMNEKDESRFIKFNPGWLHL